MIRTALHDPTTGNQTMGGAELLEPWRNTPEGTIWVDFYSEPLLDERKAKETCCGLHPLAIKDAPRFRHPHS